ncbi:uncharacterized protein KY384_000047 [Bacidia gigantensis]|uniref:uncharacterized protein n=1 Tax=Bacidia gigantensis TaxID=2732470 RepID=UPI001D03D3BD|nr:uncharacterized protein KY384_000047 [Bacidia gigantensis]KAG8526454.1 hypothetical protein KY384_000047 [Bacidia gigantensis]
MAPNPSRGLADTYVLNRDYKAASRLNYAQYLWHESLGFDLHPAITSHLAPPIATSSTTNTSTNISQREMRIADIACGTAAWLRSVSHDFPHATLDGFDVSLAQCPPAEWLPKNIHLREWNLFDEPGQDMLGRYDVVHVRLIFTIVRDEEDARRIVANLMRLLKPEGRLQWDELDVQGTFLMKAQESREAPVMQGWVAKLKGVGMWVRMLTEVMGEMGLEDAEVMQVPERTDLARQLFDVNLGRDEEEAVGRLKGTEQGERMLRRVREMEEESAGGVVICTPKVICTARKPSERQLVGNTLTGNMKNIRIIVTCVALFQSTFALGNAPELPTIVIVPGAWHSPEHYFKLRDVLHRADYDTVSKRNPSCNSVSPNDQSAAKDAAFIRNEVILPLLDSGKTVVLASHSYGGLPGAAAARGLSVAERRATRQPGGVIGLLFFSALVAQDGKSLLSLLPNQQFDTWVIERASIIQGTTKSTFLAANFVVSQENGQLDVANARNVFYNLVPAALAQFAVNLIRPQSRASLSTPAGIPAWQDPVFEGRRAYWMSTKDQAIPQIAQESFLQNSGVAWDINRFPSDHSAFLSYPQALGSWFIQTIIKWQDDSVNNSSGTSDTR